MPADRDRPYCSKCHYLNRLDLDLEEDSDHATAYHQA
jgi:hypothetical protein